MNFQPHPWVKALTVAVALCITPLAANAQSETFAEENAQERINFSGKLRMLSQRIPSAACHLNRGIDPEGAIALLTGAKAEFEKILLALEFGDADLNIINAETQTRALRRIHALRDEWEPLQAAAQALIDGTATDADMSFILTENLNVLRAAQSVVEVLVKAYANPNAATHASLMLIDISGRQRMLTQKMSKESCMIGTEFQTPDTVNDLTGTMGIFEASLDALRFGMPQVGIAPPPNEQIEAALTVVLQDWTRVKPYVTSVIDGETLDAEADTIKFQGLNVTMANMNRAVGMYTAAASGPQSSS